MSRWWRGAFIKKCRLVELVRGAMQRGLEKNLPLALEHYQAWVRTKGSLQLARHFGGQRLATQNTSAGMERDADALILAGVARAIANTEGACHIKELGCGTTAHPLFGVVADIPLRHKMNCGSPWLSRFIASALNDQQQANNVIITAADKEGADMLAVITDNAGNVYFESYLAFRESFEPVIGIVPQGLHGEIARLSLNGNHFMHGNIKQAKFIETLDRDTEREVFGLTVLPGENFYTPCNASAQKYDFIFARHIDLSDSGKRFSEMAENVYASLKPKGTALIELDATATAQQGSAILIRKDRALKYERVSTVLDLR